MKTRIPDFTQKDITDGVRKHLGSFKTKEEAIEIRNLAEESLFGEYRSLSSGYRDINVQQRKST